MKKYFNWMIILAFVAFVGPACAQDTGIEEPAGEETAAATDGELKTKASYALGLNLARQLEQQGAPIDIDQFVRGLRTGFEGSEPAYSDEELAAAMNEYQQQVMAERQAETEASAGENLAASQEFLEENRAREGVVVTESGLQYEVLAEGEGPTPDAEDQVTVHYTGTLVDGTVFDSSVQRGQPATFPVNRVIPGWTEALQLMPVGSKWKLYIPPSLGYGETGAGGVIGPNQALVFEVELLDIQESGETGGAAGTDGGTDGEGGGGR